jgi:hypothetical protein
MNPQLITLLYFYGIFLITCGIVSVIFIGMKAKTALISGGTSGGVAGLMGYLVASEVPAGQVGGIILSSLLLIVFSWRSTKTLFRIFELLSESNKPTDELKGKGIAFLIISLMAIVSVVVLALQIVLAYGN